MYLFDMYVVYYNGFKMLLMLVTEGINIIFNHVGSNSKIDLLFSGLLPEKVENVANVNGTYVWVIYIIAYKISRCAETNDNMHQRPGNWFPTIVFRSRLCVAVVHIMMALVSNVNLHLSRLTFAVNYSVGSIWCNGGNSGCSLKLVLLRHFRFSPLAILHRPLVATFHMLCKDSKL